MIMPKVSGHKDIHTLYSPKSRKGEFPNADWRFLIRAASNTARAFAAIHEAGCVIGDVNHGGVTVSSKATVKLIDCDSFQVTARGRKFLCEVGVPTFTPPELQGKSFRGIIRTPNHDNFGLAVMIFLLLFMGRHPFAGRFLGRGDMSLEQAIEQFRFAYGENRTAVQMEPPPNVPDITAASQQVALLLKRAFAREGVRDGVRPSPQEWITALAQLEKQLKQCHVNASHHYLKSLSSCPWCHVEATTGVILFSISIQREGTLVRFNIETVWNRIASVQSPGPAPVVLDRSVVKVRPSGEALQIKYAANFKKLLGYGGLIAAIITLIVLVPVALIVWIFLGMVGFGMVSNWTSSSTEITRFKETFRSAEAHWHAIQNSWEQDATEYQFVKHLQKLEHDRDQLRGLSQVRQRQYQQLQRNRERQQMRRYLEGFEIERANIPSIGPGRKAMLESYNIDTAWDVTKTHIMRVPGFGPATTEKLLRWRKRIESRFQFDPTKGVDLRDIEVLDREIANTKRKLEQNLANGANELVCIRKHIMTQRTVLRQQVDQAFKAMIQAEANMKAVGG